MIEQLFGSKTRVKLLQLFYNNPNRSFYVREITRKIDEQINSVRRELANLLNIGIISSDTNNNRLYYEVDQSYKFYKPLSMIFTNMDSKLGAPRGEVSETSTKSLGNVDLIIYTGQFTRDESSGIDILVLGDINSTQMAKYVAELEKREGKELRYVVMSTTEFNYRRQVKDRFISLVLNAKTQVILDKKGLLTNKQEE